MSKSSKKKNPTNTNIQSILEQVKIRDFYGNRKVFFTLSAILMVVVLLCCFIFGVHVSIEFKGGTLSTYSYTGEINEGDIASLAKDYLGTAVNVQTGEAFTGEKEKTFTLSFSMKKAFSSEMQDEMLNKLQEKYPDSNIQALETNDVAAKSGKKFLAKCLVAAIFASVVLILYISWRFKRISGWSAGIFAVVALLHDLVIVFGTFILCRFEIDSNFMAVILTILGYSVNDTIVIYDRIRELNPNATIIMDTVYCAWNGIGHIPFIKAANRVNEKLHALQKEHGDIILFDLDSIITGHPELIADDCVHPNAEGNVRIAKAMLKLLFENGLGDNTEPVILCEGIDYNYYVLQFGKIGGGIIGFIVKVLTLNF